MYNITLEVTLYIKVVAIDKVKNYTKKRICIVLQHVVAVATKSSRCSLLGYDLYVI